jgi:hypothetical protein
LEVRVLETSEDPRDRHHFSDRQLIRDCLRNFLAFSVAFSLVTALGEAQRPRFGIFMPRLDVYSQTPDVIDRVTAYLRRSDPSEIPLAEYPIISEEDLLSYDWNTHTMHLGQSIWFRIREPGVHGLPFVVVVDGAPLYVGAFWSHISSIATPLPVIMWDHERKSKDLVIQRAYPTPEAAGKSADPRGNPRLKRVLEELGKLEVD